MKFLKTLGVFGLVGAFGLAISAGSGAYAQSVADFYKNTRMRLIVSSTPGGGYDTYKRTVVRHIPNHLPGQPRVIVPTMPGAGGVVAANYIYGVARQDGSVIGALQRTVPTDQIMGFKGPIYDPLKFNWLGSVTNEAGVLMVTKKGKVKTFEDIFKYTTIMGTTGPTAAGRNVPDHLS